MSTLRDGELPIDELISTFSVDVPDFPEPGVLFRDLTPVFADAGAFRRVVDALTEPADVDPLRPRQAEDAQAGGRHGRNVISGESRTA